MVFIIVILQKAKGVTGSANIRKRILSRIAQWRDGKVKGLVQDTLRTLHAAKRKTQADTTPEHRAKMFDHKVRRGQLSAAVSYISEMDGGGIFYPEETDEKTGNTVRSELLKKHPPLLDPGVESLEDFEETPEFVDLSITAEHVEKVASHLLGGAGLTGFDSAALKGLLLAHGQASQRLRVVFARFIEWLANGFPPWAAYRGLLACRELALGKKPIGIRPIGIGDIFRRAAAKVVLLVAGPSATTACGADQLCAGLKAGVESGVHAVSGIWAQMDEEERQGFMAIDAENAFNSLSRINMLWNVRHLWPSGTCFA